MSTFITGATGYLGGYVVDRLLKSDPKATLSLLVRCKSTSEAHNKLWRALQMHRSEEAFRADLARLEIIPGDLCAPELGIDPSQVDDLAARTRSVLHIAASLNRKSERACLNTNLRGTLSTVSFARRAFERGGLDRFSHVSTVAVAGERSNELVHEDEAIDWNRRDYDPYARTKKFCEHMARELLPEVTLTFFRPSIVLGDSEKPVTTQFDMIRAVSFLADLPVVPLDPRWRMDIVPANYVADAISKIHRDPAPAHRIYHLSSGENAPTAATIAAAVTPQRRFKARFAPKLAKTFQTSFEVMDQTPKQLGVRGVGALMKVFWPYVTFNTVFDNTRVVTAMEGEAPTSFTKYGGGLLAFARGERFSYPYVPLSGPIH